MIFYIQVQEHVFILIKSFPIIFESHLRLVVFIFSYYNKVNYKRPTGQIIREAKKLPLFPKMWVTRKIFTRAAANLFFLIHFPEYSLFFFSFFCFFIVFLFFVLVCLFFEIKKMYSDTHSTLRAGE